MILELDVGNSRIKWRQIAEADARLIACGDVPGFVELLDVAELSRKPVMVRMCSVRGGEVNEQLGQWVEDKYGLELQHAVVSSSCGGVSNQYADPGRLGIDRWLAMLAAFNKARGSCVIIDAGTALTVDVISATGQHIGGYIVPGLSLMRDSLTANTRIRLSEAGSSASLSLGHSTDAAVFNGTLVTLLALIQRVSQSILSEDPQTKVYFTGGDADLLHSLSAIDSSERVPGLVFDGLAVACPYVYS
jgi:type III pantothenate kinase